MSRTRQFTPPGNAERGFYGEIREFLRACKNSSVSRVCRKRLPAGLKHENPLENRAFSVSQTVGQRKQKGRKHEKRKAK